LRLREKHSHVKNLPILPPILDRSLSDYLQSYDHASSFFPSCLNHMA
jgi:hypothetical protein